MLGRNHPDPYPPGKRAGAYGFFPYSSSLPACPAPGPKLSIVGAGNRVVEVWALFLYGVSVGMVINWVLAVLVFDDTTDISWFAIEAAVALSIGLMVHRRSKRLEKGRRW